MWTKSYSLDRASLATILLCSVRTGSGRIDRVVASAGLNQAQKNLLMAKPENYFQHFCNRAPLVTKQANPLAD
jgi:hypothetical protein